MTIARIKFGYPAQEAIGKVGATEDGYTALCDIFGVSPDIDHAKKYGSSAWPQDPLIDLETDGPRLIALGIEFVVVNFKGCMPLTALLPNGERYTVQIQIPHVGLLAMDEVQVCEDLCTERLQTELDRGWRIIAVCPPNAARRPDYIMGRTKTRDL